MRQKTVFVIGAGASAEFKMPTGEALAKQIAELTSFRIKGRREWVHGDAQLYHSCIRSFPDDPIAAKKTLEAGKAISEGVRLSETIDNFMDKHSGDQYIRKLGQLSIVKSILSAERGSHLHYNQEKEQPTLNHDLLESTWIYKLSRILTRGIKPHNAIDSFENCTFVVFNYDRCLEFFFWIALQKELRLSSRASAEIIRSIDIFHPYGMIGDLPYGGPLIGSREEFFGGRDGESSNISDMAINIQTYTDKIDESEQLRLIREKIRSAKKIVFLGFAYHEQNLRLLTPQAHNNMSATCFGTAYDISPPDTNSISNMLKWRFSQNGGTPQLSNKKCGDFIKEYSRTMVQ